MPEAKKLVNALGRAPLYQEDRHFLRLDYRRACCDYCTGSGVGKIAGTKGVVRANELIIRTRSAFLLYQYHPKAPQQDLIRPQQ